MGIQAFEAFSLLINGTNNNQTKNGQRSIYPETEACQSSEPAPKKRAESQPSGARFVGQQLGLQTTLDKKPRFSYFLSRFCASSKPLLNKPITL
jgi:hypothetical protein